MNYLVTGYSGIIGSGITEYLIRKNSNVITLSRKTGDIKLDLNNFNTPQINYSFDKPEAYRSIIKHHFISPR